MTTNRAPRGIPTGGQFVASSHSEPTVSLTKPLAGPAQAAPDLYDLDMDSRGVIIDVRTKKPVPDGVLSDEVKAKVYDPYAASRAPRPTATEQPAFHNGIRGAAEKAVDEISDTADAIGAAATHFADVHRGDVPAPETEGSFVGWGQMLPKFLRRKDRDAKVTEPEQESAEARNRRMAQVFGDAARAAERMDSASSRMRDLSGDR